MSDLWGLLVLLRQSHSEVRFATTSMEMLPNKTRVGVGIMKVHCTETIVTDTTTAATPMSTTLVFNEQVIDDGGDEVEGDEDECAAAVELIEKIADSPMFQRNLISSLTLFSKK